MDRSDIEALRNLRADADEARVVYAGQHASGTFRRLVAKLDAMLAATGPPPAEQTRGEGVAGAGWIEPSERDDASLVEVTLQLYARALMYGTEQQHNDAMACKAEILRRLAALSQRPAVPDDSPGFLDWAAGELVKRDRVAGSFAHGMFDQLKGRAIVLRLAAQLQAAEHALTPSLTPGDKP